MRPPQLALYSILVEWYQCKAEKMRHKGLRIRWKESGVRLAAAMEENKPIKDFQAKVAKLLEDANKQAKSAQAAVQNITSEMDKLKQQDKALVNFLFSFFFSSVYLLRLISPGKQGKECSNIQDNIATLHQEEEASKKAVRKLKDSIARYERQLADLDENAEVEAAPLIAQKVYSLSFVWDRSFDDGNRRNFRAK